MTIVFAIAAHPDDIEFGMAGTLLELKAAGAEIHMWNLANGSCGTKERPREEIIRIRQQEAAASALLAGAILHPPLVNDLEIFYELSLLRRVAAVIREVKPSVLLVPSLQDYMEDHVNTARLAVSGAFAREMCNFDPDPPVAPWDGEVAVYHAMPHGGNDLYGRLVHPLRFVDISRVIAKKTEMLSKHESQRGWLRDSQGMDSYLKAMLDFSQRMGELSGRYAYAEGWMRHNHLGLANSPAYDPIKNLLASLILENSG